MYKLKATLQYVQPNLSKIIQLFSYFPSQLSLLKMWLNLGKFFALAQISKRKGYEITPLSTFSLGG